MRYNKASFYQRWKTVSSFLIALSAITPFMIYLCFGYLARVIGLADEAFLNKLNTVVFKCFFPFLMFWNLYNVDEGLHVDGKYLAVCVGSLLLLVLVLCLTVPRIVKDRAKQSVIIQAAYRSNFVLFGIPMAESLVGNKGAALATVTVAIIVPLYNAIAVILFEHYRGGDVNLPRLVLNVLKNPLIMGALVGLLFLLLGIHLPVPIEKPVHAFSDITTPLAMFVLGGTLHVSAIKANRKYIWPVLGLKLLVLPLIATLISVLLNLTSPERVVLLLMSGAPVAVSSYTMAANMGGDGELAGQYVFLSTIVSLFTLFLFFYTYHATGFIA